MVCDFTEDGLWVHIRRFVASLQVSDGVYSSVNDHEQASGPYSTAKDMPLIDFGDGAAVYDNREGGTSISLII